MTDRQFEEAIKPILYYYEKIELEMIKNIGKRLIVSPDITANSVWLLDKLRELGGLTQENLKILAKYSKLTTKEIEILLNKVGIESINLPQLTNLFENGKIIINPSIIKDSIAIQNIIALSTGDLKNTFLNINKSIIESANQKYVEILNTSYLEVTSGIYDYNTSIRKAINKFGDEGISASTYQYTNEKTGELLTRRYDIAGVVRRDTLTASHQLAVKVNTKLIDELKPEYVRLSEHIKCRETHFPWQGTIIKREKLEEITGLGEVDGLGGVNCKHMVFPYFGEARGNDLKKISREESSKEYELSQQQRKLERDVRRWKRKEVLAESSQDEEMLKKAKEKRKYWQTELRTFVDKNDLIRDYIREKV